MTTPKLVGEALRVCEFTKKYEKFLCTDFFSG